MDYNITKIIPIYDSWSLLIKGKIRLPKVDHPKFKGDATLNEDEYQTSVQL